MSPESRFTRAWFGPVACALAACASAEAAGAGPTTGAPREPIEGVEGVDLRDLTGAERDAWVDLVNRLLSPCGEPVSVARCAARGGCASCLVAARYLLRLVLEGYDRDTIDEYYEGRFGRDVGPGLSLDGVPVRGAEQARLTLVVFSDFQCPYCGQAHPSLLRVLKEHPNDVRLVFKHFPLGGHPRAMPAARAAESARLQGRFWEMHDRLFENQDALEEADFDRYAADLGLDVARFRADRSSPEVQARIDADLAEGARLGIEGTPTLFVAGRRFREPMRALDAYVKEELAR